MATLSFSAPKFGVGIVGLLACAALTTILGQKMVEALAFFAAIVVCTLALGFNGKSWLAYLWDQGWQQKLIALTLLLVPSAAIVWYFWPDDIELKYNVCHRDIVERSADGSLGVAQVALVLALMNEGNSHVYARDEGSTVSLDNFTDDVKITDPPLRLLPGGQPGYLMKPLNFDPPRSLAKSYKGNYHFKVGFDQDPDGKFEEKMSVKGEWQYDPAVNDSNFYFTPDPHSDKRVKTLDCKLRLPTDPRR